jgi:hypothetical protein
LDGITFVSDFDADKSSGQSLQANAARTINTTRISIAVLLLTFQVVLVFRQSQKRNA